MKKIFGDKRERIAISASIILSVIFILYLSYLIPIITWSIPETRPFEQSAIVSFSSDDGLSTELNTAIIMRETGYRMTFFVSTSKIGMTGYLSWNDLLKLQSENFEIGSHGITHKQLTQLSLINATKEMTESKSILESHGLHINCFAFPYGSKNSTLMEIANQTYTFVRYNYSITNSDSYSLIDSAIENKTWINLSFHSTNPMGFVINNQHIGINLRDILGFVAHKNITVATQIQAYYLHQLMT